MKNRKGFTITELVIVIAVIAILAAVLIPTFSGMIKKAEESTITQETRAALTVLLSENNGTIPQDTYVIYINGDEEVWFKYDHISGKLGAAMDATAVATTKGYYDAKDLVYAKNYDASKVLETGSPAQAVAVTKKLSDLSKNVEIFVNN